VTLQDGPRAEEPARVHAAPPAPASERTRQGNRLRFNGVLHTWGFALYLASNGKYEDSLLPTGLPFGSPEQALDCACGRALMARRQINAQTVVSSDEIRAELFGVPPVEADFDAVDARVFGERDRRIVVRLAAGRSAVAESTNVTPQARARLLAIARRFNAPVTMLRFSSNITDLLHQHSERRRPDVTAADVRAYAAIMMRDASAAQLRSDGAAAVHDVPGLRQGVTPAESAEHFFFC
jgi:predicted kinase